MENDNTFYIEIMTPERVFFKGMASSVIFATPNGELEVLKGYVPTVTIIAPGVLRYRVEGQWRLAANSDGFVSIDSDITSLFCQTVEAPDEIEPERAKRTIEIMTERMRQSLSRKEYLLSRAAINRAIARLKAKNRSKM